MAANAAAAPAAADVQYSGIAMLADGRWRSYIVNVKGERYPIGEFATAATAALAQDRTILAILGPNASAAALHFRAAFSDTELRFLHGRHGHPRAAAGVAGMLREGSYDDELARFAASAFDAYMDPELALDVANFRLGHRDALRRRLEEAAAAAGAGPAARAMAERDAEREAFLEAARNKAMDEAWVASYHLRRRLHGPKFEDENRWPQVLPDAAVDA
ncbi:hypothetical protein ACP70R_019379 [Stipagrostis hirtigluma subsp. patula]